MREGQRHVLRARRVQVLITMLPDSPDVELVYFDPTLAYLSPHALRTFTNAMAWQKYYEPFVLIMLTSFVKISVPAGWSTASSVSSKPYFRANSSRVGLASLP